jgi:hypothetical protein
VNLVMSEHPANDRRNGVRVTVSWIDNGTRNSGKSTTTPSRRLAMFC